MPSIAVEIGCIADRDGLARLAPEWDRLWRRAAAATPFQSPHWLLPWWRHFGNREPRLVAARAAGELVGLLPLYLYRDRHGCKLLPIGIGVSDYLDALIAPECPELAGPLLAGIAEIGEWRECHLPELAPGAALAAAPCPPGVTDEASRTVPCPVLALPQSPADFDRAVPRKTLRDLRQARARARAAGPVALEAADSDTLDGALDDLFRLHEQRWRSRGEAGVCADPAVRAFHREAARALLAAGVSRLYRLRLGGAVLAAYYGFVWRRRAYAYLGGFDPDRPRLSPGALIIGHAIAAALGEGVEEFDFMRGGEAYKYGWGATDRWNRARTLRRR